MKVTTTRTLDFECLNKEVLSRDQGIKRIKEIAEKYDLASIYAEFYRNDSRDRRIKRIEETSKKYGVKTPPIDIDITDGGHVESSFLESVEDVILLPHVKFFMARALNPVKDDGFCYTNYVTVFFKEETIEIYYFEDVQTPKQITGFDFYTQNKSEYEEIHSVVYDEDLEKYIVEYDI